MAYPKNGKSAILALAVSGGLWAWQNRDKVAGWLKQQQGQLQQATGGNAQPQVGGSYTGATRRISETELDTQPEFNPLITPGDNKNSQL